MVSYHSLLTPSRMDALSARVCPRRPSVTTHFTELASFFARPEINEVILQPEIELCEETFFKQKEIHLN